MAAPLLGRPGRDAAERVRRSARVHANSGSAQVVLSAHGRVWLRTLVDLWPATSKGANFVNLSPGRLIEYFGADRVNLVKNKGSVITRIFVTNLR